MPIWRQVLNKLIHSSVVSLMLLISHATFANEKINQADFSGKYVCDGDDFKEGKYQGQVSIQRIVPHSTEEYTSYQFELVVPGFGKYPGHAAAYQNTMAIYFANTQHLKNHDFGTGIATFNKNSNGKWTFKKFYYEPEFKGGNHGVEICTQQ